MPNSAVIIIDALNDFFDRKKELAELRPQLCKSINELTAKARENDIPIIWVKQEYNADLSDAPLQMRRENISITIEGTEGAQFLPELNIDPADEVVIKKRYSAFFRTRLDELLERLGVKRIILAGVNTHACVRMAAIDAYQRDLEVVIAKECVASYDQQHHDMSLKYLDGGIARVELLQDLVL